MKRVSLAGPAGTRLMTGLILTLLVVWPAGADATGCSVVGKADSRLSQAGKEIKPPARLEDCTDLRVSAGTVAVCRSDARQAPLCREFKAGQAIDAAGSDAAGSHLVDNLLALLRGSVGSATAMSRGSELLLPKGVVLLRSGRLSMEIAATDGLDRIEIRRGSVSGALVHAFSKGAANMPAELLAGPHEFWAVPIGASSTITVPTRFRLASRAERDAATRALAAIDTDRAAGPLALALMRAAWLEAEHYEFDARSELLRAGVAIPN